CGRTPPSRRTRSGTPPGLCAGPVDAASPGRNKARCRFDLATTTRPLCTDPAAARDAQHLVDTSLDHLRHPPDAAARHQALATLTDLAVLAAHLATAGNDKHWPQRRPTAGDLRVDTLLGAFDLLTAPAAGRPDDPLAPLVARHADGPRPQAVPQSWKHASPTLTNRIAHSRDESLRAVERIRHATTQPEL
nr:hypothetical protein [Micromonospora sp. DSM 115978]